MGTRSKLVEIVSRKGVTAVTVAVEVIITLVNLIYDCECSSIGQAQVAMVFVSSIFPEAHTEGRLNTTSYSLIAGSLHLTRKKVRLWELYLDTLLGEA